MRRCLFILSMFTAFGAAAHAQTFSEWFKQKKTQKKYLIQQIIALQVYIGYAKKGYEIARQGLTAISDLKNGEFNLHKDYFNSLKNISPAVKHDAKIAAIIALQAETLKGCQRVFRQIRESRAFSRDETSYFHQVFERLLDDCADISGELITLTTAGELEMTDAERLERIDRLYGSVQDDYIFLKHFSNQALILAAARIKERNNIDASRALYGIKNK